MRDLDGRLVGLGWDHRFLGFGLQGFPCFVGLFILVTGTCLEPTMTLGANFAILPFLLVVVTSFCIEFQSLGQEWGGEWLEK